MAAARATASTDAPSPFMATLHERRYLILGVLVVAISLAGWFLDDLRGMLPRKKFNVAAIQGTWRLDEPEFAKKLKAIPESSIETKKYHQKIADIGEQYKTWSYSFKPDSYTIQKGSATEELPCAYEGGASNAVVVHGDGSKSGPVVMSLIVDKDGGRMRLCLPDLVLPLKRSD